MTEFEHAFVGMAILAILWHLFIKHYFVGKKDVQTWQEIINRYFSK